MSKTKKEKQTHKQTNKVRIDLRPK